MKKRLLMFAVLAVLIVGGTGCSKFAEVKEMFAESEEEGDSEKEETSEAPAFEGEEGEVQDACSTFFEAYTALDGEKAGEMIRYGQTLEFSELQGALSEDIQVVISSIQVDGGDAEVQAQITNIDMEAVIEGLPEDISSKEEATEAMIKAIKDKDAPTATFEVTLLFTKTEETWLVEITPELSDALLGGYQSFLNKLLEEMIS